MLRKKWLRQRNRQMQKKGRPMQKLRTPLATDYKQATAARCYQHLRPAPTGSGTSPTGTSLPVKLAPSTIDATDGVYPRPAPPPLSSIQLFPRHAAGRSALRFCCHFLFPLPLTVHRRVGMSASCPSECPSALAVACQHRPVALRPTYQPIIATSAIPDQPPPRHPPHKKQIGTTLADRPDTEQRIIFLLT